MNRTEDVHARQETHAKSQVKHEHVRVKVRLVVTIFGVEGKNGSWEAPSRIRENWRPLLPPVADLIWDITLCSWIEPDFDGVGPSVHDEIPATRAVERVAEGCVGWVWVGEGWVGVREKDTTPRVEVDSRVTIVGHGFSTKQFLLQKLCREL